MKSAAMAEGTGWEGQEVQDRGEEMTEEEVGGGPSRRVPVESIRAGGGVLLQKENMELPDFTQ